MLIVWRQRHRVHVSSNDEIRMTKLEIMTNDQMTKRSRSWTSSFGLRHSFVLRNSCFVICLLILATGISVVFAQKRNITEKDLWIMTKFEGMMKRENPRNDFDNTFW